MLWCRLCRLLQVQLLLLRLRTACWFHQYQDFRRREVSIWMLSVDLIFTLTRLEWLSYFIHSFTFWGVFYFRLWPFYDRNQHLLNRSFTLIPILRLFVIMKSISFFMPDDDFHVHIRSSFFFFLSFLLYSWYWGIEQNRFLFVPSYFWSLHRGSQLRIFRPSLLALKSIIIKKWVFALSLDKWTLNGSSIFLILWLLQAFNAYRLTLLLLKPVFRLQDRMPRILYL